MAMSVVFYKPAGSAVGSSSSNMDAMTGAVAQTPPFKLSVGLILFLENQDSRLAVSHSLDHRFYGGNS